MRPEHSPARRSSWLAWALVALLGLLAAVLAVELQVARREVANLEMLRQLAESERRSEQNHHAAERIVLNRALTEALRGQPSPP